MSAWNRFLGKVRRGVNKVADKVEEWGDCATASVRAKSLEISIDEEYENLGRLVYRALNTEEDLEAEKQEIMDKLDELIAELDAIKIAKAERKAEAAQDQGTEDACADCADKQCEGCPDRPAEEPAEASAQKPAEGETPDGPEQ